MFEDCDPSAHGEVVAIRNAGKALKTKDLQGCSLYTNFEPCPMCAAVIWWSRSWCYFSFSFSFFSCKYKHIYSCLHSHACLHHAQVWLRIQACSLQFLFMLAKKNMCRANNNRTVACHTGTLWHRLPSMCLVMFLHDSLLNYPKKRTGTI